MKSEYIPSRQGCWLYGDIGYAQSNTQKNTFLMFVTIHINQPMAIQCCTSQVAAKRNITRTRSCLTLLMVVLCMILFQFLLQRSLFLTLILLWEVNLTTTGKILQHTYRDTRPMQRLSALSEARGVQWNTANPSTPCCY